MLALIEKGAPHEAHPAYWAPFVVVVRGLMAALKKAGAKTIRAEKKSATVSLAV